LPFVVSYSIVTVAFAIANTLSVGDISVL